MTVWSACITTKVISPLKALAFDEAVNTTLGLPIIRTSVDHGTALDIAGQGNCQTQQSSGSG